MKYGYLTEICQQCFEMGRQMPKELIKERVEGTYLWYYCPDCGSVRIFPRNQAKFRISNALRLQVLEQEML